VTTDSDTPRGARPAGEAFDGLLAIIRRLRGPDGCQWDRQQTPLSLRSSLLQESWEAISAIEAADDRNLVEELGDLYLLVTMIAYMKEQEGAFPVGEALEGICAKLVRRHPHVFADAKQETVEGILAQWDRIKREEKREAAAGPRREPPSALDGVPRALPPLERAQAIQQRAARVGFDWPAAEPVWAKLAEEESELRRAVDGGNVRAIEEELGDLLFTVVNLARLLGADASLVLRSANEKFARRFREVERRLAEEGSEPAAAGLERMDAIWNQLKGGGHNSPK
jgi:tetrapyrrole methylase family protein/MazG family protein